MLESKHVSHRDVALNESEEIGSLVGDCGHQDSSIRGSRNNQVLAVSNFLSYEILSCSDEVIKVILSLLFFTGILPFKSFFATASNVSNDQYTS